MNQEQATEVAALMLGVTLSDVANLGGGLARIQHALFQPGHPNPAEGAYDRLVSHKSAARFGGGLGIILGEVLQAAQSNPIRLVQIATCAPVQRPLAPPTFPVGLFHASAQSGGMDGVEGMPLIADTHLHSGASMSLDDLVRILVRTEEPIGVRLARRSDGGSEHRDAYLIRQWAGDARGQSYSLAVVLGGVKAHLSWLLYPRVWSRGKECSSDLLSRGLFWESVGTMARDFGPYGSPLFDELTSSWAVDDENPDVDAALRMALDGAAQGGEGVRSEFLGLMGGLCLLNSLVASVPGEGLTRFVDRFDRMGLLKDLSTGRDQTSPISRACRNVFAAANVEGAEFRKTAIGYDRSIAEVEADLHATLTRHLLGFEQFTREASRTIRASVPVGFLRERRAPTRDEERWSSRYALRAVSSVARAILNLRHQNPTYRTFFTGVDVAGDENAMPNWPFLNAFQMLSRGSSDPLRYSIHAGESFGWELQGIRRVGEILTWSEEVDAIGHCLALDQSVSRRVVGEGSVAPTRLEAISDLAWLVTEGVQADSAADLLSVIAAECPISALGVGAQDLVNGWKALYSLDKLQEFGIVSVDGGPQFVQYANGWDVMQCPPAGRAAWGLAYLGPGTGAAADLVGGYLAGPVLEGFNKFQRQVAPPAREHIINGMQNRVATRPVVVESCPTSNVRLAGLGSVEYSHIRRLAELGLAFTISSDDPIIFSTNICREWGLVAEAFGLDLATTVADESVKACSASIAQHGSDEFGGWRSTLEV